MNSTYVIIKTPQFQGVLDRDPGVMEIEVSSPSTGTPSVLDDESCIILTNYGKYIFAQ